MIRLAGRVYATSWVAALAAAQQLVLDVNHLQPSPASAFPSVQFAKSDGQRVFFDGYDVATGTELWVTDGTPAGTRLVRDLVSGPGSGFPEPIQFVGNRLLLSTRTNGTDRSALWVTDGTTAGTAPLTNALTSPGSFLGLGVVQGRALFYGRGGGQLIVSDLTPAGTQVIAPMLATSTFVAGVELANAIVFAGNGDAAGAEPWVSDGTTAGTQRLADIAPAGASGPDRFARLGNAAFFFATGSRGTAQLWRSDGTVAGTTLVVDTGVLRSVQSERLVAAGSSLLAIVSGALWRSDGTFNGTAPVLLPAGASIVRELLSDGTTAFLVRGSELWVSDGTQPGTTLVLDLGPGTGNARTIDARSFVSRGRLTLGTIPPGPVSLELIRSDGTTNGTTRLTLPAVSSQFYAPVGTRAVLSPLQLPNVSQRSLIVTDGTAAGTQTLLAPTTRPGIATRRSVSMDGDLYVMLDDGVHGNELWRTDGTANGTRMVVDLMPTGSAFGAANELVALDGALYFTASSPATGYALWRSDGTTAGTRVLFDPNGPIDGGPGNLHPFGHDLYFTDIDPATNRLAVFRSDGTTAGTRPIPGTQMLVPSDFTRLGNVVLFGAGGSLSRTDGTAAGTFVLPAPPPFGFANLGDRVLFLAAPSALELWVTDGTVAGTQQLLASLPAAPSSASAPVIWRGKACWLLDGDLVMSDGTVAGTTHTTLPIPPALPLEQLVTGRPLVPSGNALYLVASDAANGSELWSTDGTIVGTTRATDLAPSFADGVTAASAVGLGDRMFVAASDGIGGLEPYVSDGTAAGTTRIVDLAPNGSSNPRYLGLAGDRVIFVADDGVTGQELWSMPLAVLGNAAAESLGIGCPGSAGIPQLAITVAPRLGGALATELRLARPFALCVHGLALDRGPNVLPSGCVLHLGNNAIGLLGAADGAGTAQLSLAIPATASLLGTAVAAQALVLDPTGTALTGIAASNGLLLVVGR